MPRNTISTSDPGTASRSLDVTMGRGGFTYRREFSNILVLPSTTREPDDICEA